MSIEDAIEYLLKREISSLAGSWDPTDEEVEEIKRSLKREWAAWRESA